MDAIEVVGYILAWLIESPVLTLAYLFLLLAAWGPFLGGLGITDLFWHRQRPLRFVSGLATGCVVGLLVHIRYLVPTSMRQPEWLDHLYEAPSMLWWFEGGVPFDFGTRLSGWPAPPVPKSKGTPDAGRIGADPCRRAGRRVH